MPNVNTIQSSPAASGRPALTATEAAFVSDFQDLMKRYPKSLLFSLESDDIGIGSKGEIALLKKVQPGMARGVIKGIPVRCT